MADHDDETTNDETLPADAEADACIRDALLDRFPEDRYFGEEIGLSGSTGSGRGSSGQASSSRCRFRSWYSSHTDPC